MQQMDGQKLIKLLGIVNHHGKHLLGMNFLIILLIIQQ